MPAEVRSSNVEAVRVAGSIASLKVAVGWMVETIPVAPSAGVTAVTVGGVTSAAAAVVNDQTRSADRAFPARSLTAPPLTRAVNVAELPRAALGVSVAVRVAAS